MIKKTQKKIDTYLEKNIKGKGDIVDFFLGFIALPTVLFFNGFIKNLYQYTKGKSNLGEGEVIMIIAIMGTLWKLLLEAEFLKEPKKKTKMPFFNWGVGIFLFLALLSIVF